VTLTEKLELASLLRKIIRPIDVGEAIAGESESGSHSSQKLALPLCEWLHRGILRIGIQ